MDVDVRVSLTGPTHLNAVLAFVNGQPAEARDRLGTAVVDLDLNRLTEGVDDVERPVPADVFVARSAGPTRRAPKPTAMMAVVRSHEG